MTERLVDGVLESLLRARGEPLSGQRLAEEHGVTRAAVWKGVETLRRRGYEVESLPGRGYRLAAGRGEVSAGEIAARLATRRLGKTLRHLAETASTNRDALAWADEGAPEGALVVADRQTAGRGRLGRAWHGEPGESLLMSLVLRPPVAAAQAPLLTFVAAAALAEALGRWIDPALIEIKWPNDLLVEGRKVAGILLEARTEGARAGCVVVGLGVNVAGDPARFPPEIRETAGIVGRFAPSAPEGLDVLCGFLEAFEELYERFLAEGFAAIRPRWDRWFAMAGREVTVHGGKAPLRGRVAGLGDDGALVLEAPDGTRHRIHAGDVSQATTKG